MVNRMIIANVLHRPVRTIVSILAVAIEVSMVMLVVGMTTGLLHESAKRVEGVGADALVQPPGSSFLIGLGSAPVPIKIGGLLAGLQHVQAVTPVLLQTNITGGLNIIYGIDMKSFERVSGGFVYYSGGPFTGPYDIMVDNVYAQASHVKVGQTLTMLDHPFHVCGIVEHGKGSRLFIPLDTAQDLAGSRDKASIFFEKCTDPGYADDVVSAIRHLLPDDHVMTIDISSPATLIRDTLKFMALKDSGGSGRLRASNSSFVYPRSWASSRDDLAQGSSNIFSRNVRAFAMGRARSFSPSDV